MEIDALVQRYMCDEMFVKIRSVFPQIQAKLLKNALSRKVE